MSADLSLSILDFQHPGKSVTLACAGDEWGYKRFWLGEHHTPFQCANPILLGALLAGTTSRIRVGTGGVSLTYHSALRIAEDARLVEFMMPDRFDLGVTRGLLADPRVSDALLEAPASTAYPEKIRHLHGFVTGRIASEHPLAEIPCYLQPHLASGPPLWILGLSMASARLAASLGVGFCFSVHHAGPEVAGPEIVREYIDHFRPSPEFHEPAVIAVVRCVCAATEKEARSIEAHLVFPPVLSDSTILGSPEQCADRIGAVARDYSTREVMIIDFIQKDQDARLEMYRLLGQTLGLQPSTPGTSGGD